MRRWLIALFLALLATPALAAPPQPAYVTGTVTTGALAKASGPQSVTTTDLTGDCTTSGTPATTCAKTNGVAFATSATTDTTNASNITSGNLPAAQMSTNLSAAIDSALGSAQGDILYRDSSLWKVLAPGTAGYFLKTQGAGANPLWAVATGGVGGGVAQTTGTWTPTLKIGGATTGITYATQGGYWIRTGDVVAASANLQLSSKGSLTGTLTISGLPYLTKNTAGIFSSAAIGYMLMTTTSNYGIITLVHSDTMNIWRAVGTLSPAQATNSDLASTSEIDFTLTYQLEPGQ